MTMTAVSTIGRPEAGEHAEYYSKYTRLVPEGDIIDILERQMDETAAFLRGIPVHLHGHRYAEGKWSVKEVIGHLTDAERIFSYRALRFGRGDATPLASFDENAYVATARFPELDYELLVEDFTAVRRATLTLLRGFNAEEAARQGEASGWPVSVRALAAIMAGHVIHHTAILRERYLAGY